MYSRHRKMVHICSITAINFRCQSARGTIVMVFLALRCPIFFPHLKRMTIATSSECRSERKERVLDTLDHLLIMQRTLASKISRKSCLCGCFLFPLQVVSTTRSAVGLLKTKFSSFGQSLHAWVVQFAVNTYPSCFLLWSEANFRCSEWC